ncbi:MAG: hypothetical protein Q8M29_00180 [Bacteroidota bacterium]|nr:hypothetical protein [Bacteroidota bacterium]
MEVIFYKIHETVLEALEVQDERPEILEVIGKWYYNFLISPEDKLSLSIPDHNEESLNIIYNYLRLFSLTNRLLNKPVAADFANTCLFNVFDYNKRNKKFNVKGATIDFEKKEGDFLIWAHNTVVGTNRFLPIFKKEQIENSQWDETYSSFKLFKAISNQELINHPLLIDFKEDLCLSISTGNQIKVEEYVLFKTLKYDSDMSEEAVIEYEDDLCKQDITNLISIKYPYHKNIHGYLLDIGKKKFDLVFNSRFCYYALQDNDIVLLPKEIEAVKPIPLASVAKFEILNTNHSVELFNLLDEFYYNWKVYDFNKFTTPFPKYWLLFINPSIAKEDWFEMFKSDYPNVAEKPIINEIKKIIYLIHELDWGMQLIKGIKDPVLLLPDIKGARKKKLEKSLNSFKHYLTELNSKVLFIENDDKYDYNDYSEVLLLDAFNIINLVNIFQKNNELKVLTPDFLYFHYQPWIKYHLLDYQYDPLLSLKRQVLDSDFQVNKESYQKLRQDLIQSIKLEIGNYRKKYKGERIEVESEIVRIESEDIVFNNEEEIELVKKPLKELENKKYLITTVENKDFAFEGSNQVLIRKNSLISNYASQLIVGDCFVLQTEINSSINKDLLVDKLSKIPDPVIDFQIQLSKLPNVYETLKRLGIEYSDEKYFNDKYVIEAEDYENEKFILPKKKENWKIICEFLGITSSDMFQTWISHYGRRHINDIKRIYKRIYDLCLESNYISEIENPDLVNKVSEYIAENSIVFATDEEIINPNEVAKSILSAIINEIKFHEVKEIKTI